MKLIYTALLTCSILFCQAQVDENEFVLSSTSFELSSTSSSANVIRYLTGPPQLNAAILVTDLLSSNVADPVLSPLLYPYHQQIANNNDDYAVIIVYRKMNAEGLLDSDASKTLVYHRSNRFMGGALSKYLLETSHIALLFIDLEDSYYEETASVEKLLNTKISISYAESVFRQSAKDLGTVLGAMGDKTISGRTYDVKMTWVEIEPKKIKAPCTLVLANKSFSSDLKFVIHERNVASFQVGLVNSKIAVQDFKISDGNIIVAPDSAKQQAWKSNLFAALEIHLPRDVDNFKPLWKSLFYVDSDQRTAGGGKAAWGWLYRNTLNRIGVYGGVKIAKDPLSNLYAGFNYAITKDLYANFGWTWSNEIVPQVTDIGSITSVSEAEEFLDRKYTKPTFALGLSFSPSAVITMFGLKDKEK